MKTSNFMAMLIAAKLEADTKQAAEMGVSNDDIAKLKAGRTDLPNHTMHYTHTGNGDDCEIRLVRISDHLQNSHKGGLITKKLIKL